MPPTPAAADPAGAPATEPATIALVRSPIAPLQAEPRVASPQVSQALFGRALLVIGRDGDWLRVRTLHDGYEGWAHPGYLDIVEVPALPDEPQTFGAYEARRFGIRDGAPDGDQEADVTAAFGGQLPSLSLGCTVAAGPRRLRLPLGAVVHAQQEVLAGKVVSVAVQPRRFPADGGAIVASAERFFGGTGYQWGGVTPWGADCSGFVQTLFGLHGVDLPRDAWQQALVGEDAGADLGAHRAGDLLFFSERDDRRVTHVGLALGDGRMAHLALGRGGWAVDALAAPADAYAERLAGHLTGARRVL